MKAKEAMELPEGLDENIEVELVFGEKDKNKIPVRVANSNVIAEGISRGDDL